MASLVGSYLCKTRLNTWRDPVLRDVPRPEITKGLADDLRSFQLDVNEFIEAGNKVGAEEDQRFIEVVDQIGSVEAHMGTVPDK